jgi:hypothetical protein
MQNAIVITGRLIGPMSVELDEPVSNATGNVEVIVRGVTAASEETVSEFLRRLPAGTRSKEDIDRQMRDERDAWGERE